MTTNADGRGDRKVVSEKKTSRQKEIHLDKGDKGAV